MIVKLETHFLFNWTSDRHQSTIYIYVYRLFREEIQISGKTIIEREREKTSSKPWTTMISTIKRATKNELPARHGFQNAVFPLQSFVYSHTIYCKFVCSRSVLVWKTRGRKETTRTLVASKKETNFKNKTKLWK